MAETTSNWDIRIVGHDLVPPDELLAHPSNWRNHPRYQQEALRSAIKEVGFLRSPTVNRVTGHVLDGHLRIYQALEEGQPLIPVEYVDIPPEKEALVLATFDPIAALATAEQGRLAEVLSEIETREEPLQHMLAKLAQGTQAHLDELDELTGEADEDPDHQRDQVFQQRYPLPIVLDQDGFRRWTAYKQQTNIRSDTQAFLFLLVQAQDGALGAATAGAAGDARPHRLGLWPDDADEDEV